VEKYSGETLLNMAHDNMEKINSIVMNPKKMRYEALNAFLIPGTTESICGKYFKSLKNLNTRNILKTNRKSRSIKKPVISDGNDMATRTKSSLFQAVLMYTLKVLVLDLK
jgi:hypothetical protein